MAYSNGNLALQPKRKPEDRAVVREKKKIVVKRKSLPVQEKLLYLFTVTVCVIVAGVIIFRYAQIYKMNWEIKQLTNQYQELAVETKELRKQVEMLADPERIREQALAQGMVEADQAGIPVKPDSESETAASAE
ncbi:septum formation initiator family protein [Paenibacillus cisolokensis]|uniref:cell division protein FtsL n=1 Tax=Paenibacillus cisolokensis TaxID=1658519 RepID=UPI003D2E605D